MMIMNVAGVSLQDRIDVRHEFPLLYQSVNGHALIYLDNAATTQKPARVIQALNEYYHRYNANIYRGIHTLAEKATREFEETRTAARFFINATSEEEIIFVRGVTEAINLVAASYGRTFVQSDDEIIVSALEHHSNIVPWQIVCNEKKALLRVIPANDKGELMLDAFQEMLSSRTRLVAVSHISNSLGTVNPIQEIVRMAHRAGALVLVDGAQAGAHKRIDVQQLDCDFYCLSAHKMYGPTGVGMLYGKKAILEKMPPYQSGGEMIREVTFGNTIYQDLPYKFEAGTPDIGGVIAFRQAIEFILETGRDRIAAHEHALLTYATEQFSKIPSVRIIGNARDKSNILSFIMDDFHPYDIGHVLDARGIAVRTGQHCTQPIMDRLGVEATVRASFAAYNTTDDIDELVRALRMIDFIR